MLTDRHSPFPPPTTPHPPQQSPVGPDNFQRRQIGTAAIGPPTLAVSIPTGQHRSSRSFGSMGRYNRYTLLIWFPLSQIRRHLIGAMMFNHTLINRSSFKAIWKCSLVNCVKTELPCLLAESANFLTQSSWRGLHKKYNVNKPIGTLQFNFEQSNTLAYLKKRTLLCTESNVQRATKLP